MTMPIRNAHIVISGLVFWIWIFILFGLWIKKYIAKNMQDILTIGYF
jgi:hypothetical protein